MLRFAELLGVPLYSAWGLMEGLWLFVGEYAPTGAIGKFSNNSLAQAVQWDGKPDDFVDALVRSGFVDQPDCCPDHRLVIHDWQDHVSDFVKKRLQRKGLQLSVVCPENGGLFTPRGGQNPPNFRPTEPNRTEPKTETESNPTQPNPTETESTARANLSLRVEDSASDSVDFDGGDSSASDLGEADRREIEIVFAEFYRLLQLPTTEQVKRNKHDLSQLRADISDLRDNIVPAIILAGEMMRAKIEAVQSRSADVPIAAFKKRLRALGVDIQAKNHRHHPRETRAGPTAQEK